MLSAAKSWNYGYQVRQQCLHPERDAQSLNYLWESKGNMTVFIFHGSELQLGLVLATTEYPVSCTSAGQLLRQYVENLFWLLD